MGHGGSGWILVDLVVVGGGLRRSFIANKNENNNNKIINKNVTLNREKQLPNKIFVLKSIKILYLTSFFKNIQIQV